MSFWLMWVGLPPQVQVLVAGAVMTYVVDVIRLFAPKVDGRWVHILTGGVTALASVVSVIATSANSPIVQTLSVFLGATIAAIGLNEIKRGPGTLGKKREAKAVTQYFRAKENRSQKTRAGGV